MPSRGRIAQIKQRPLRSTVVIAIAAVVVFLLGQQAWFLGHEASIVEANSDAQVKPQQDADRDAINKYVPVAAPVTTAPAATSVPVTTTSAPVTTSAPATGTPDTMAVIPHTDPAITVPETAAPTTLPPVATDPAPANTDAAPNAPPGGDQVPVVALPTQTVPPISPVVPDTDIIGVMRIYDSGGIFGDANPLPIREQSTPDMLNELDQGGLGHYAASSMPGHGGCASFSGHRTTYGGVLLHIDSIALGDNIVITTSQGVFTYTVVAPADYPGVNHEEPVRANYFVPLSDCGANELRLMACTPIGSASHQYVIRAVLQGDPLPESS